MGRRKVEDLTDAQWKRVIPKKIHGDIGETGNREFYAISPAGKVIFGETRTKTVNKLLAYLLKKVIKYSVVAQDLYDIEKE